MNLPHITGQTMVTVARPATGQLPKLMVKKGTIYHAANLRWEPTGVAGK
jgi:hypothetical protein